MKKKNLLKDIKGVFKPPQKQYYFGKLQHGTPYFYPRGFVPFIFSIRKLKFKPQEIRNKLDADYPWNKNDKTHIYSNYPVVRRSKNWVFNFFKNNYYIEMGNPIAIVNYGLGWKDKWDSPRYEWAPSFQILFFNLQFCIWWNAPLVGNDTYSNNDEYYEMILWYLHYSDRDIKKAKSTWGWVKYETQESTWDDRYLL